MDGRSLVPLLGSTPVPQQEWRADFLVELWRPASQGGDQIRALRTRSEPTPAPAGAPGPAVYVEYLSGARELYDLVQDPYELDSLHLLAPPEHLLRWSSRLWDLAAYAGRTYASWAAGFGLAGTAAAAGADPDSDGVPNGAEYILGGNPTVSSASGRPTATISGGNMIFTFPRDDASQTPDVTLTVETGTDLVTWPAVFTIGPNAAGSSPGVSISENETAPDTITVTIPQGPDKAKFARLKVTIAQ